VFGTDGTVSCLQTKDNREIGGGLAKELKKNVERTTSPEPRKRTGAGNTASHDGEGMEVSRHTKERPRRGGRKRKSQTHMGRKEHLTPKKASRLPIKKRVPRHTAKGTP